jgi:hypothetical protein
MKLLLLIIGFVALCSLATYCTGQIIDSWAENQIVGPPIQIQIITDQEAEIVMEYHGILFMEWSIPHKDFIFKRDGEICRARAFEILKEGK